MIKDVTLRDTHIDWIPQIPTSWEILRSKYVFQNKSLKNNPNEPLLSVSQRDGVVVRSESDMNVWNPTDDVSGYKLIEPGDFVISLRSFEGGLELSKVKGIVSPAYTVLETIRKIDDHYFWWLMKSHQFIIELNKHVTGIRQGKNIGWDDFSNIYLTLPPLEEQKLISRYLDKKTNQIDSLISKIEKKIELLKEQRTSLINQYVTKGVDPNVEMKDSGVEWIGEIPKHWKLGKLKYLSTLITKGTTPSNIGEDYDDSGEVRFLKGEDLLDGRVIDSGKTFISSEVNEKLRRSQLAEGDLLVVIAGTLGKCAVVPESVLPANTNQAISLIRFREGVNSDFIRYWFETSSCKNQISEFAVVAAQPNLSMEDLGNIIVPVITTDEQNEIEKLVTEKTTNINERIFREVKRIDLLQEYRQSLISSTVTGKVRVTEEMI